MFDFLRSSKKNSQKDLYMGLILKENEGEVILLSADRDTRIIHPIDQKKFTYTNSWEHLDGDVDQTLFELEKRNGVEIEKTVLFIYSHFVDQEKKAIKNPYKTKIKALGDELGLTIMGFVEFHEALGIYFHTVEQTPLSAIVIELDGPSVTVFVYKAGKVVHAQSLAQTTDLIGDLEKVFASLKGSYLPARMILYDSTDLTEISNDIMTHSWDENVFIQIPKVEVVAPEKLQNALYSCFSKQIFEDANGAGMTTATGTDDVVDDTIQEPFTEPVRASSHEPVDEPVKDVTEPVDEPIDESSDESIDESADAPVEKPTIAAAAGFAIGEDIAKDIAHEPPAQVEEQNAAPWAAAEETPIQPQKKSITIPSLSMPQLALPHINFMFLQSKGIIIGGVLICILAMLGGIVSVLYSFHTAHIVLLYKTPKISKEIVMNDIRTKDQSKTLTVSGTIKTTGKKTIGTEAKGTVQIFNVEKAQRSLKKGTELKSNSGIVYVLNDDVKIASASSSTTSGGDVTITTGKQKATVTAKEIGPNANVSKGTPFIFDGISSDSLKAEAESAFTGGTKRDITTVSREDMDKLAKNVKEDAKNKAKNAASIEQLATVTLSSEKYSNEIGQEANELSLNAKATVTIPQSDETAIKSELARKLSSDVEDGFSLTKDSIQYVVTKAEEKKNTISATLKVQAKPQYLLNRNKLLEEIKGKSVAVAEEIAKNDFRATDFDITVDSLIPFLKTRIPFFDNNIQTETRSL